jgi:hypothetical protein
MLMVAGIHQHELPRQLLTNPQAGAQVTKHSRADTPIQLYLPANTTICSVQSRAMSLWTAPSAAGAYIRTSQPLATTYSTKSAKVRAHANWHAAAGAALLLTLRHAGAVAAKEVQHSLQERCSSAVADA